MYVLYVRFYVCLCMCECMLGSTQRYEMYGAHNVNALESLIYIHNLLVGGRSADKTYLFQQTKALLNPSLMKSLEDNIKTMFVYMWYYPMYVCSYIWMHICTYMQTGMHKCLYMSIYICSPQELKFRFIQRIIIWISILCVGCRERYCPRKILDRLESGMYATVWADIYTYFLMYKNY